MQKQSESLICGAIFVAFAASLLSAQSRTADNAPGSCRGFVQAFYNWYVPQANRDDLKEAAFNLALTYKRSAFTRELFRKLKADSDAQARAHELVGLDFDPFLNSQDPESRYEVRTVHRNGGRCRAEVYGAPSKPGTTKPDVIAELVRQNGKWVFANFQYPDVLETDLLRLLKDEAIERQKKSQ